MKSPLTRKDVHSILRCLWFARCVTTREREASSESQHPRVWHRNIDLLAFKGVWCEWYVAGQGEAIFLQQHQPSVQDRNIPEVVFQDVHCARFVAGQGRVAYLEQQHPRVSRRTVRAQAFRDDHLQPSGPDYRCPEVPVHCMS